MKEKNANIGCRLYSPLLPPVLPYHFLFRTLYQDCYINEVSPTMEVYVATQFATILTEYAHLMKRATLLLILLLS